MSAWLAVVGTIAFVGGSLFFYFQFFRPIALTQKALKSLAAGDFSAQMLSDRPGFFKESTSHVRKIAERLKQFDRQVIDEEFNLRAILSSMVEGVLIVDRSQRIRLANDAVIGLFDLTISPINRTVIEVFRKHELQHALEAALLRGAPQKLELVIEGSSGNRDSSTKHFDVHVAGLNHKPNFLPVAVIIVFHDVTTIRGLEAVRREFVANVSHEFRTPLAIIAGYLETLLDGALDDRDMAEHSLEVMHKNTRRLSLLIDDLLSISRLEDRAKLLDFRPNDLRDILSRVLDHLEPNLSACHAKVEVDWAPGARVAEVDALRIEEVFSNLLGNAIRHGACEDLRILIRASLHGSEIRVCISDNGPGIPSDDQPHIFERFYRVHKDRSRDAGGTGLGLSIVKNVVQAHGGRVRVESALGCGAAFHISLPLQQISPQIPKNSVQLLEANRVP